MSEHYPRIRIQTESGYVRVRVGLSLTFYMHRSHQEIAGTVLQALDVYLRTVGPGALGLYASEDGEWRDLDAIGWELIRRKLLEKRLPLITLQEASETGSRYGFMYYGRDEEYRARMNKPNADCEATFWLPTEFLEEHGPGKVRDLALELAALLPWCTGFCGLSFNGELDMAGVPRSLAQSWFCYPGIDVPSPYGHSNDIGTRVNGVHWLNFLGPPVLGELGGSKTLRERLHSPGTLVEELGEERVLVSLGTWPEAGDTERAQVLPPYRELATVLEPWLFRDPHRLPNRSEEESRRWERRFLD
jgi:hypothetical protein